MKILKKEVKKEVVKEKVEEKVMGVGETTFVSNGICSVCAGSIGTNDNLEIFSTSDCTHYPKA